MRIEIVPLSCNNAFKGRRFKTDEYKQYEKTLLYLLPKVAMPKPPYCIEYEFGFSNKLSDIDNPLKQLQDILCKKYAFDDREIYKIIILKKIVEKGKEYVKFDIKHYD